jgi:hypothetical protein
MNSKGLQPKGGGCDNGQTRTVVGEDIAPRTVVLSSSKTKIWFEYRGGAGQGDWLAG